MISAKTVQLCVFIYFPAGTTNLPFYRIKWLVLGRVRKIAKKKKVTGFVMSVRPSPWKTRFRMEDFHEIWGFFYDFSNNFFIQNLTRTTGTLLQDLCTVMINNSLCSFQNQKWFREKIVEKIKTYISCSITFFCKSCLYEIM